MSTQEESTPRTCPANEIIQLVRKSSINTIERILIKLMQRMIFQNAIDSVHALRILFKDAHEFESLKDTKDVFFWEKGDFLKAFRAVSGKETQDIFKNHTNSDLVKLKVQIDLYHVEQYLQMLAEDFNRAMYKLNECAEMLLVFGKIEREQNKLKVAHENMKLQLAQCEDQIEKQDKNYEVRLHHIEHLMLSGLRIEVPIKSRHLINHSNTNKCMTQFAMTSKENDLQNNIDFFTTQMDQNNYINEHITEYLTEYNQKLRAEIEFWSSKYELQFDNMEAEINQKTAELMYLKDLHRSNKKLMVEYQQGLARFFEKEAEKERLQVEEIEREIAEAEEMKRVKRLKKIQAAREKKQKL